MIEIATHSGIFFDDFTISELSCYLSHFELNNLYYTIEDYYKIRCNK